MLEFLTQYGFTNATISSEHYRITSGDFSMGVTYNAQISKYRPTLYTIIFGGSLNTIRLDEDNISSIDWQSIQNIVNCETDADIKTVLVDIIFDNLVYQDDQICWGMLTWRYKWLSTHEEMMRHSPEYREKIERDMFESKVVQYLGKVFWRKDNE